MNKGYISIRLISEGQPPKKGILCDHDDLPVVFDSQFEASEHWRVVKEKTNVFKDYDHIRGSCQSIPTEVEPEGYLDDILYDEDRVIVKVVN